MAENKEFLYQPMTDILNLLQQSLDCSDLSAYTELIIKHIQSKKLENASKVASEEVQVTTIRYVKYIYYIFKECDQPFCGNVD